jgi:hypothetical protein
MCTLAPLSGTTLQQLVARTASGTIHSICACSDFAERAALLRGLERLLRTYSRVRLAAADDDSGGSGDDAGCRPLTCVPLPPQASLAAGIVDGDEGQAPIDVLAWQEGRALISAATVAAAGAAGLESAAAAAVQELCELLDAAGSVTRATGTDAGATAVSDAGRQLTDGMLRLCARGLALANNSNNNNNSDCSSRDTLDDGSSGCISRLRGACDAWLSMLAAHGSLVAHQLLSADRNVSTARARGTATSKKGSRQRGAAAGGATSANTGGAAAATAAAGAAAATVGPLHPDWLACAALSQCLLALAESSASPLSGTDGGDGVPGAFGHTPLGGSVSLHTDADALLHARRRAAAAGGGSAESSDVDSEGEPLPGGDCVDDDEARWKRVGAAIHAASVLLQQWGAAAVHTRDPTSSVRGCCRGQTLRRELAAAAAAAWYVAGLHGWDSCQAGLAAGVRTALCQGQGVSSEACSSALRTCNPGLTADSSSSSSSANQPWLGLLLAPLLPQLESLHQQQQQQDTSAQGGTEAAAVQSGSASLIIWDDPQLTRAVELLSLSHAAADAGDVAAAVASAQDAVVLTQRALQGAPPDRAALAADLCGAAPGAAALRWRALGLAMAALWHLGGLQESAGSPDDALRALKLLTRLSSGAQCAYVAALAAAATARVRARQGQLERARAAADAAHAWLLMHQRRRQVCSSSSSSGQLAHAATLMDAVADASVAAAHASCDASARDWTSAASRLDAAAAQLSAGLAQAETIITTTAATAGAGAATSVNAPLGTLSWHSTALRARIRLEQAHYVQLSTGPAAGQRVLQQGLQELEEAGAGQNSACPAAWANLRLQQLLWAAPVVQGPADGHMLQLVGLAGSSAHSDLQSEFACAAESMAECAQQDSENCPGGRARRGRGRGGSGSSGGSSGGSGGSSTSGRGRRRQLPPQAGASAKQGSVGSGSGGDAATAASNSSKGAALHPVAWVASVLQLLPVCSQQPLVLARACSALLPILAATGAVCAAAAVMHLSLGKDV